MVEWRSHALGPSLVLTRLGQVATTPPREQQLVERLQTAARGAGCGSDDLITALYIGLKMHARVCVCGPSRDRTMALLQAIVTTMVGPDSIQTLHLHGPIGHDQVAQRLAALRLGEFVGMAIEPTAHSRTWFALINTPGDPSDTLRWVEHEIHATLRANGVAGRMPSNLFVLVAAGAAPVRADRGWLALRTPRWAHQPSTTSEQALPPVGYQRLLLDAQLTGAAYRQRLRRTAAAIEAVVAPGAARDRAVLRRWCAASTDERGHSLWRAPGSDDDVRAALHHLAHWCAL